MGYDSRLVEGRRRSPHLPLFRSDAQARILAAIFLAGESGAHVTELAKRTGLPVSTVHREIARLDEAGLLRSESVGRARVVRPDERSPYIDDVRSLVLKAYGPPA